MQKRPAKRKIKVAQREKSPLWRQIMFGVLFLCIASGLTYGVYKITRLDRFQVAAVVVSGGETLPHDIIEKEAEKELEGDYYKVVPKRFVFATPEEEIVAAVKDLPRVADVQVETFENEVRVAVTEYEPYVLLCHAEECFFAAHDGTVFAQAPELRGRSFARVELADAFQIKSAPVAPARLAWMVEIRDALLKEFSWSVRALAPLNDTDVAIFFTESTLFVRSDIAPQALIAQIKQILQSDEFAHLSPEEIEYVDMRYGNKVFVKEKGVEVEGQGEEGEVSTEEAGSE